MKLGAYDCGVALAFVGLVLATRDHSPLSGLGLLAFFVGISLCERIDPGSRRLLNALFVAAAVILLRLASSQA